MMTSEEAYTEAVNHWALCVTCSEHGIGGLCPTGRQLWKRYENLQAYEPFLTPPKYEVTWKSAILFGLMVGGILYFILSKIGG